MWLCIATTCSSYIVQETLYCWKEETQCVKWGLCWVHLLGLYWVFECFSTSSMQCQTILRLFIDDTIMSLAIANDNERAMLRKYHGRIDEWETKNKQIQLHSGPLLSPETTHSCSMTTSGPACSGQWTCKGSNVSQHHTQLRPMMEQTHYQCHISGIINIHGPYQMSDIEW